MAKIKGFRFVCIPCKTNPEPETNQNIENENTKVSFCAIGINDCILETISEEIVDWVFCESCEKWFHCPCVNVDSNLAKHEDYEFLCNPCTTKQNVENDIEFEEEQVNLITLSIFIKVYVL